MSKKIGIIGGMGPAAGCDLHQKIIALTPAKTDQEHAHVVLDTNTNITDRTAYILDHMKQQMLDGEQITDGGVPYIKDILNNHQINNPPTTPPREEIVKSAKFLEAAGCDIICMSCVTAHYFENDVVDNISTPFASITEIAAQKISDKGFGKAALMVTNGALCGQVFEPKLKKYGIEPIYPSWDEQRLIMDLVYKYVKPGNYDQISEVFDNVLFMIQRLRDQGAQAFILGCTELPIAFDLLHIQDKNLIDVTYELAHFLVSENLVHTD